MLSIENEEKQQRQQQKQIHEQIKICFFKVNSVVGRVFLGIPVYIATLYFSGTEEHSPWLVALSVKVLEFKVSRLA